MFSESDLLPLYAKGGPDPDADVPIADSNTSKQTYLKIDCLSIYFNGRKLGAILIPLLLPRPLEKAKPEEARPLEKAKPEEARPLEKAKPRKQRINKPRNWKQVSAILTDTSVKIVLEYEQKYPVII